MNWKREATDKLRDYRARKAALENLPAEIRRLEEDCVRIRSAAADGTPVRGSAGNSREDRMLSNIVLRDELKRRLKDTRRWLAAVDRALGELTNEERLVLDRFYIHRVKGNVEILMDALHLEQSAVYDKKDKALRRFTLALYGAVES